MHGTECSSSKSSRVTTVGSAPELLRSDAAMLSPSSLGMPAKGAAAYRGWAQHRGSP